jgi:hypothetical protein
MIDPGDDKIVAFTKELQDFLGGKMIQYDGRIVHAVVSAEVAYIGAMLYGSGIYTSEMLVRMSMETLVTSLCHPVKPKVIYTNDEQEGTKQ